MTKDRCGNCGGNGDKCLLVKSVYTKNYNKFGKNFLQYYDCKFVVACRKEEIKKNGKKNSFIKT